MEFRATIVLGTYDDGPVDKIVYVTNIGKIEALNISGEKIKGYFELEPGHSQQEQLQMNRMLHFEDHFHL